MSLTGDLGTTSLIDLIDYYCLREDAVSLVVTPSDGPCGVFYLEKGTLVDGRLGDLVGVQAVRAVLRMRSGEYRFEPGQRCQERTIFEPWKAIVLEAARQNDEANAHRYQLRVHEEPPMAQKPELPPQPVVRQYPTPSSLTPALGQGQATRPSTDKQPTAPILLTPPQKPPRSLGRTALAGALLGALVAVAAVLVLISQRKDAVPAPPGKVAAVVQPPAPEVVVNGITDEEIVFGMSAPFSGSAKELGRGMKTGVELAFSAVNDAGGVHGRKLRLVTLDDGYEPTRTKDTMRELVEQRKVFGVIGNVGTPTSAVAVPYVLDHKTLFFGAFTGAGLLRKDPPDRYVFNYRSSYAEETGAAVRFLVEQKRIKPEQIAVFAQEDSYGDAGFLGVINELRRRYKRDPQSVLRVGYKRNTFDVQAAVDRIADDKDVRAVVMVPSYRAAARFVEKVKEKRADVTFTSVSFVGASALAEEFQQLNPKIGEGVIVTQVVPLPTARSSVALRYQELLQKFAPGERPDFVSFEGYLAANVMIEALKQHGRAVDTEGLVGTLEKLRALDLGIGAPLSFGLSEHQASHKVWGTVLDAQGKYQSIELD